MPLTNSQLAQALKKHSPNRGFAFPFGGYEGLVMDDGQPPPPLAELEATWPAVVAAEQDLATKRQNVKGAVTTLREWATEAATAVNAWDGQTQTQKNATVKVVIGRLGTLMSRFADLIESHGFSR